MKFHAVADALPLLKGKEWEEFVADINAHGMLSPIVTYKGEILDGRNRWLACQELGIEAATREWAGECGDPVLFILTENIHRRHMDVGQRAVFITRYALPALQVEAGKRTGGRPKKGEKPSAETREVIGKATELAAAAAGIGARTVEDASAVERADPKLADAVLAGELSLGQAKRQIKERELGVDALPDPIREVVRDIIHQPGVPAKTAATIVSTAAALPKAEQKKLAEQYKGSDFDQGVVKTRLALMTPPPDPRCVTLTTVARELREAAKRYDDEWSGEMQKLAEEADEVRKHISEWRKAS